MKLAYPLKDSRLRRYLTADEHYDINEKQSPELDHVEKGGWFPVGINNFWHAGVHLDGDRPVHAVADGKIVAYRVTDTFIQPSDLQKTFKGARNEDRPLISFPISHNFVLTQHLFEPPGGDPFYFYLLYMHLLPLKELEGEQKKTLSVFHQSIVKVKHCDDLDGKGLLLFDEAGKELVTMPQESAVELCEKEGRPPGHVKWALDRGLRQVRFSFYGEVFQGFAQLDGHTRPDPADSNRRLITADAAPNRRKNGVNIRKKSWGATEVIGIAPVGAIICFDEREGSVTTETGALRSFTRGEAYRKITGYVYENREYRVDGYVYVDSRYFETEKRHDPVVNQVEQPDDLKIRQGDVLGWSGRDGSAENKRMVHLELFVKTDNDLAALRRYTISQLANNTDLEQEELLQLKENCILNEQDITAAYVRTKFVSYVSDLIAKASEGRENLIKLTPEEAVTEETVAPLLRQMVVKHHPEWLSFDKDEKMKERWMYPPYKWPQEKYDSYQELYLGKLAFWDQLKDEKGKPFPDEVYFFHPIKFIEHLKMLNRDLELQIGLFFDGTCGNKKDPEFVYTNIACYSDVYKEESEEPERIYKYKDIAYGKRYITGVGGESLAVMLPGLVWGYGGPKKLEEAVIYLEKMIKDNSNKYPLENMSITLDVFGFSRGAALARHFVNVVHQKAIKFSDTYSKFDLNKIKVRFLGVFDTVGSFGMPGDNVDKGYEFHVDNTKAMYIYHMTAEDEVRADFDLQTIKPGEVHKMVNDTDFDPSRRWIIQESFPGSHSDIGGGHAPNKEEDGCDNNFLSRIYMKRMLEKAISAGVPFLDYKKITKERKYKDRWAIPKTESVEKAFETITDIYDNPNYLLLKKFHYTLREHQRFKEFIEKIEDGTNYVDLIPFVNTSMIIYPDLLLPIIKQKLKKQTDESIAFYRERISSHLEGRDALRYFENFDILKESYMHTSHWPFCSITDNPIGKWIPHEDRLIMTPTIDKEYCKLERVLFPNQEKGIKVKTVYSEPAQEAQIATRKQLASQFEKEAYQQWKAQTSGIHKYGKRR